MDRSSCSTRCFGSLPEGPCRASTRTPSRHKANIPQISPSNTYIGLTTNEPGSEPGEPNVYYPSGKRTYARVVPRDKIQGAALVTIMKQDGCKTTTLWNDKSTYGAGLARNVALRGQASDRRAA